jgi:hypothetical protein
MACEDVVRAKANTAMATDLIICFLPCFAARSLSLSLIQFAVARLTCIISSRHRNIVQVPDARSNSNNHEPQRGPLAIAQS